MHVGGYLDLHGHLEVQQVNNLANSHNLVGVTPAIAPTAAVPYVQNAGDLLNLLPGRSVMVTLTAGWAPRR